MSEESSKVEPMSRAELVAALQRFGIEHPERDARHEISRRKWEFEYMTGTLGNFCHAQVVSPNDQTISTTVHFERDDKDLGERYAEMSLLLKIIKLEL